MSGAHVAFDGTDAIRMRAASALVADHRIDRIGLIGRTPPASWGRRAVHLQSAAGWDVVVGLDPVNGAVDVTMGSGGVVSGAGPSGLARALAARLGADDVEVAGTVPGEPRRSGPRFGFPAPIGWLHGSDVDGVYHCPLRGSLAAVMAVRGDGSSVAVVDDRSFLDGCALAAGVLLAAEGCTGPVWESAERYLELLTQLGVVTADRPGLRLSPGRGW